MKLFGRKWRVRVDDFETDILDVAFDIEKTLEHKPNSCSLVVYNLSADHRHQLEQLNVYRKSRPGHIRVEVEAGYEEGTSLLFRGDLRTAVSKQEGLSTWATTIEGEDGGRAMRWSRVNQSFPPGTPVATVVRACAQAMGVGEGNTSDVTSSARFLTGGDSFRDGTVLSGPAPDELRTILRSLGLTYSVQDGVLQILRRGAALQTTAVRLAPGSGLVEYPVRSADGKVAAKCLLIPDLYPGRKVFFDTESISGFFRIRTVKYSGDTSGQDWYATLTCQEVT